MSFLKKRFDDVVVRKSGYLQSVFTIQLLKMKVYKIRPAIASIPMEEKIQKAPEIHRVTHYCNLLSSLRGNNNRVLL